MSSTGGWTSLGTGASELRLEFTLPTGQSFRWKRVSDNEYTGVVCKRVIEMRQEADDVLYRVVARAPEVSELDDAAVLHDYFNLGTSLTQLSADWASRDKRFQSISPYFPGARMLRQDPVECLFQFICSSNNHISRIHGMVDRLCTAYGTPLYPSLPPPCFPPTPSPPHPHPATSSFIQNSTSSSPSSNPPSPTKEPISSSPLSQQASPARSQHPDATSHPITPTPLHQHVPKRQRLAATLAPQPAPLLPSSALTPESPIKDEPGSHLPGTWGEATQQLQEQEGVAGGTATQYYAFPTLQQLALATEEELRGSGFGYRAKFIVGSVKALSEKEGGGESWLMNLRQEPCEAAIEALCTLPGIGPKVAACAALFSLDKHEAIPVDTHVWQLAVRYYTPHLAGKSLTKGIHVAVAQAFVDRFGPYAGWAHNTLFISELASMREQLPPSLQPKSRSKSSVKTTPKKRASPKSPSSLADAGSDDCSVSKPVKPAIAQQAKGGHKGLLTARQDVSLPARAPASTAKRKAAAVQMGVVDEVVVAGEGVRRSTRSRRGSRKLTFDGEDKE